MHRPRRCTAKDEQKKEEKKKTMMSSQHGLMKPAKPA
jgi:hypothetical protein